MNREIKFRAWNHRNEDWETNSFDADLDEERIGTKSLLLINTMYHKNNGDLYTFQLASGLNDRDGIEIFEGDILQFTRLDNSKEYFKVWHEKGGLVINIHSNDFNKPTEKISFFEALANMQTASFLSGSCEIIGNIFENPELLEC